MIYYICLKHFNILGMYIQKKGYKWAIVFKLSKALERKMLFSSWWKAKNLSPYSAEMKAAIWKGSSPSRTSHSNATLGPRAASDLRLKPRQSLWMRMAFPLSNTGTQANPGGWAAFAKMNRSSAAGWLSSWITPETFLSAALTGIRASGCPMTRSCPRTKWFLKCKNR